MISALHAAVCRLGRTRNACRQQWIIAGSSWVTPRLFRREGGGGGGGERGGPNPLGHRAVDCGGLVMFTMSLVHTNRLAWQILQQPYTHDSLGQRQRYEIPFAGDLRVTQRAQTAKKTVVRCCHHPKGVLIDTRRHTSYCVPKTAAR